MTASNTITTNRQSLISACDRCSRVTPTRSTLPIIANCLIDCEGGRLTYRATNLTVEASGSMPGVGSGRVCVSPKDLSAALAGLTGDTATLTPGAGHVTVTGSTKRSFKLATLSADDFPAAMSATGASVELPAATLSDLITSVAFAARRDSDRPEQNAVRLEPSPGGLRAVTADGGRRVAIRDMPSDVSLTLSIPLQVAQMLSGIKSGVVTLCSDERTMSFTSGDERLVAQVPSGDFPPISNMITQLPRGSEAKVDSERLLDAVKALSRVDNEFEDMRLAFSPGLLVIECSGKGSAHDEIECQAETPFELWLPSGQLSEALSSITGEVTLAYGPGELDPLWVEQASWKALIATVKSESVAARKR